MAVALLAACTQDELAEQGNTLPDGEYPLQIGSVTITAESSEEPWTRVAENETDGMGSHWTGGEEFYVKFEGSDEVGIYKITDAATGAVEDVKPIYWKSTQPANIIAWYAKPQPNAYNGMTLRDQDRNGLAYVLRATANNASYDTYNGMTLRDQDRNGLAYVLRATANNASYDTPVSLQFKHQLAKVRVVTKGTVNVGSIAIQYPPDCSVNEGIVTSGGPRDFLDSYKTYYEGIGTCWEINLPAGNDIEFCRVTPIENSAIMRNAQLTPPVTLEAGKVHTVTITANREGTQTIDLSNGDYTISGDGIYYFSGTASHAIRVTGGSPNIYLEDAQINVSNGNAIDITGGASPTIHVMGEGNSVASTDNTGIAVSGGATLTIEGRSTADMLTATAGNGGAGIGSPLGGTVGGNITIGNVTIHATGGSGNSAFGGAGIGSSGSGNCGDVTIADAVIVANGGDYSSGIGMGYGNTSQPSIGKITITNSDVTAKAGRYASAIGFSYTESVVNPTPDYRAGQIIITTDNLETFLSKLTAGGTAHAEFAAYAQRIGVGSHAIPYPPSLLNQDGSGPWEGVVINGTVYADGYE